jgi:hypothetical protein
VKKNLENLKMDFKVKKIKELLKLNLHFQYKNSLLPKTMNSAAC